MDFIFCFILEVIMNISFGIKSITPKKQYIVLIVANIAAQTFFFSLYHLTIFKFVSALFLGIMVGSVIRNLILAKYSDEE